MPQKSWLKAVAKEERPLLSARNRRLMLDLANGHKDWTVEGQKEAKTNRLGSNGRMGEVVNKLPGEGLTNRLVEGTLKYRGGSGMALDMHARLMGGLMATFTSRFWMKSSCSALDICTKPLHR